jgi:hypothetical protein
MKSRNIKKIKLGPRQFTFGFDNDFLTKQTSIMSCIHEQYERNRKVFVDNIVQIIKEKHDLLECDILQNIFWFTDELRLYFTSGKDKTITPQEAKKILLETPKNYLQIHENNCVDQSTFQDVVDFYNKLSNKKKQYKNQYEFAYSLFSDLQELKKNISSFQSIAKKQFYPGGGKMNEYSTFMEAELLKYDSYSIIHSWYKNKEKITNMINDLTDIFKFYKSQTEFWESLINAIDGFYEQVQIIRENPVISDSLDKLIQIVESPDPYHLIEEAKKLLKDINDYQKSIVQKEFKKDQEKALIEIETMISNVSELFEIHHPDEDIRHEILYNLRSMKKRILQVDNTKQIEPIILDTRDLLDDLINELQEE